MTRSLRLVLSERHLGQQKILGEKARLPISACGKYHDRKHNDCDHKYNDCDHKYNDCDHKYNDCIVI